MNNLNKIMCADCFDFIKRTDDRSVDLALIDPPYFLNKGEWDTFRDKGEFFDFTYKWIDALIPKLKDGASFYVFNTPYNSAFILSHLVKRGLNFQNWICWDKRDGFTHTRKKFIPNQETILFFSKGEPDVFNADEVRIQYDSTERMKHASRKGILKKNGSRWFPDPNGKLCGDVWHITSERHKNKVNGKTVKMSHTTPKPLEMIERIIRASSKEGDVVFDCFVGSGTTAVAAKKLKRNFLCADKSEEFIQMANNRLGLADGEDISRPLPQRMREAVARGFSQCAVCVSSRFVLMREAVARGFSQCAVCISSGFVLMREAVARGFNQWQKH